MNVKRTIHNTPMKYKVLFFLLLFFGSLQAQQTQTERLRNHLYLLASDSLEGRMAGSNGGLKARQYLLKQYQAMGLEPYRDKYIHTFKASNQAMILGAGINNELANIVMVIPGNDPELKEEYIVLGAHYDHVGVKNGKIHNGADDNASGSSALVEIARQIYAHRDQLKRTVIIAAFDAEEEGLFGSKALVNYMDANGDIKKVKLMMSIDMVGWLSTGGALSLEGSSTLKDVDNFLHQLGEKKGITIRTKSFENSIMTATDTEPFAKAGCPTLAVTTGLKSPYHKPEDDADLIDYDGLNLICDYIAELTLGLAADNPPLVSSQRLAAKHQNHLRPFEIGLSLGFGRAGFRYPGSAFYGKTGLEGHIGITTRLNYKRWSLQAEALYNIERMPKPNLDGTVSDVFGNYSKETHSSLFVPVSLLWNVTASGLFYLGAGANYRLLLNHTDIYHSNLWGFHYTFGFKLGQLKISVMKIFQLTPYYIDNTKPKTKSLQGGITLTYML